MPFRYRKNGMRGAATSPFDEPTLPPEAMKYSGKSKSAALPSQEEAGREAMQYVMDHPGVFLATAVAVGVILGWLVKRR
jgi:ElaB/YqjD/DUF883 family membrane-anchored ribosome-binding protein